MHDRIATIFRLVCVDKPLHYFVTSVLLSFSRTFFLRNRCQRWLGPVDGYNCYWNSMVFVSCLLGPGVLHIHKTLDRFNTTLFISHNIPMSISGENGKDQDGIIFDLLRKAYSILTTTQRMKTGIKTNTQCFYCSQVLSTPTKHVTTGCTMAIVWYILQLFSKIYDIYTQ